MKTACKRVVLLCCAIAVCGSTSGGFGAEFEAPPPRCRAEIEAVLAQAPASPANEELATLDIVLLADVKDHGPGAHDYPLWQKRWALLLGGRRAAGDSAKQVNLFGPATEGDRREIDSGAANVEVTKAWQWPAKEQWESADLIVMQCYRSGGSKRTWSEQRIAQLEAYLSRGGGFVAVHPATYTLRDLSRPGGDRVAALTGMAFDRSILVRHGPMRLTIASGAHPILAGLPETIDLVDEPYWPPVGDLDKVTVLATSNERTPKNSKKARPQPMFWTARHGKGRIFACVPGHFVWTFDDPYFRILLLRGMAWASGASPYRFDVLVTRGVPLK